MNRLSASLSPYLLQHAANPVDWYPWSDEALDRARREQKPIFLSIGYSACHWCHVMERESFTDETIAAALNRAFVCIKVDREERPDLDRVYMKAVQLMTGRGGWPLSAFLTPDLEPFYGGTYFPPEDRHGLPGFLRVVTEIARLWQEDRQRLLSGAKEMLRHLRAETGGTGGALDREPIRLALAELDQEFDEEHGGFGGAPKFPPAGAIELLLREHARTGNDRLLHMARRTLDAMARGGIRDHLGGGFHRYAVDDQWLVPHFEKMLYDNALLARLYLDGWLATSEPRFRQVAAEILDFVLREMTDPGGGFHSAFDADSEGVEGKYYVWSRQEIQRLLPPEDADAFLAAYGVTPAGNFEGRSILHLPGPSAPAPDDARLAACRARLLAARAARVPPARDDKVLTDWNALMVSALVRGYLVLDNPRYRAAAERAAAFLLDTMHASGPLLRVCRHGQARTPGFLDDYAYLADALLDLFAATGNPRWFQAARTLAGEMLAAFGDPDGGGFFHSRAGDPHLLVRERCFLDEARPSPNAIAARVLLRLSRLLEEDSLRQQAERALAAAVSFGRRFPTALAHTWCVLDDLLAPPEELVIVGDSCSPAWHALRRVTSQFYRPNLQTVLADSGVFWPDDPPPLLRSRQPADAPPAAYLCRNHACLPPVATPEQLQALLE